MNKRKIIILLVLIIVLFTIISLITINKKIYSTYSFGDSGVSITVFNKFQHFDDERAKTDVSLHNQEIDTYITGRDLPDSFWASGDMMAKCDEYTRMISAMYYDRDISDVSLDIIKINGVEVGKIAMTVAQKNSTYKAVSLLFPKKFKNLVIEIYGNEKKLNNNDELDKIIKGIKIN